MTVLKILLLIALVLFLLGLIRVGGEAEYSSEGFWAKIKVGALRFQVFPIRKKEKVAKTAKTERKTSKTEGKTEEKKGGAAELVKSALPIVGEALRGLKRRIRIDMLELNYTACGANDAAGAAMTFGYANAAVGAILPIFEENFELKDYHVHIGLDFKAKSPAIYLFISFSGRIGALLLFFVRIFLKFLKNYLHQKKEAKQKSPKTPENQAKTKKEAI